MWFSLELNYFWNQIPLHALELKELPTEQTSLFRLFKVSLLRFNFAPVQFSVSLFVFGSFWTWITYSVAHWKETHSPYLLINVNLIQDNPSLTLYTGYNFTQDSRKDLNSSILTYHRIIEAFKFAYAYRARLGDEDNRDMREVRG